MRRWIAVLLIFVCSVVSAQSQQPLSRLDPIRSHGGSLYEVQTQLTPTSSKAETVYAVNTGAIEFLQRIRNRRIWRWQSPQSYHSAAVMVRVSGGAGSGVIVRVNGNRCIVLTCEHVIEGNNGMATVTFLDGTQSNARVLSSWREYDVAGLLVERPPAWAVGLPLASKNPPVNSPIEVMGFGGPKYGDFRPFVTVNQTSQNSAIELDAPSIPGDSGAGMVWNGGIVGIQFGAVAEMRPVKHYGVPLVYPASSKGNPEVLSQFVTQICSPMGMQPIYCDPQVQIDIQGRNPSQNQIQEFYPPSNWEYQPQAQPPQMQPQIPAQYPQQPPALNNPSAEEIAQAISNSLREYLADLRGEKGDQGPAGPKGDAGEVSTEQLAAMAAAITQQLKADPSLRGDRGPEGPPGKDGERGPAGPGISDISMDGEGYVYVQYGANGRREQIGRLQLPEQSAGERSPAYFEIVPKR